MLLGGREGVVRLRTAAWLVFVIASSGNVAGEPEAADAIAKPFVHRSYLCCMCHSSDYVGLLVTKERTLVMSTSTDENGPLIDGRPALTVQEVQSWCHSAYMPNLDDIAAAEVARQLNHAALLRSEWAPEFAELRKANPSMQRLHRVAGALATLRSDLPGMLDGSHAIDPNADMTLTEALLDLVQKHQLVIDEYRHTRGRPYDPVVTIAANIGRLLSKLCDPGCGTAKAHDAFVAKAMAWLSQNPPADAAISRNRRRRALRA